MGTSLGGNVKRGCGTAKDGKCMYNFHFWGHLWCLIPSKENFAAESGLEISSNLPLQDV
jgi:hypothetical protein